MSLLNSFVNCRKAVRFIIINNGNAHILTNISLKSLSSMPQNNILNRNSTRQCDNLVGSSNKKYCTIPKNPLDEFHSASQQPEKGAVYDKKPFKMVCEEGKKYCWCTCGKSKNQPLCDGTHRSAFLKIKLRPVRFTVTETKEYFLCNCKQTNNRPFCDGAHKQESVQGASVKT